MTEGTGRSSGSSVRSENWRRTSTRRPVAGSRWWPSRPPRGLGRRGAKSCAQWLAHQCSLAPSAARAHVRVARRLAELPLIRAAFGRGELSSSKVRALSRVATAEEEEALLDRRLTAVPEPRSV